jgi:VIT1/CCC1 family predicted Fe2+/Mn2+ transporter
MIPYFPMKRIEVALFVSIGAAGVLRIIAGYAKQIANGCSRRIAAWDALQTLVVGAATAAASYGAMRGLHSSSLQ